ncbi:polygalacturonase, putative [Ricinus communis]|uniref:Polygalacturonase, putative n=1 Tax=Ricinus communis TaxID=3988 RepID=B9SAG4_RICCO|nr:polygalacturonase, putative [Ricinus communis]|eukprot:XP_002522983.1 BURP domain-containing protein 5 [Ricinus communis]
MEFHLLLIFALFLVVVNGSNYGALPGEMYWKSKFPSTPLPKALQELLQPTAAAVNKSSLPKVELIGSQRAKRATYGVGYWTELKTLFDKNAIYNKTTIYFLYNDLYPYKKMKLIFTESMSGSKFLPRKIAQSIPFSNNKLQEILNYFSIESSSKEAQIMKQTIQECEAIGIRGEDKYCATSFESLADFVTAKFGKKIRAFSNEVEEENKKQEYTILKGIKMIRDNQIVCHKQRYKYAIFYCHTINGTEAYMVPLVGEDGSRAKAVVICHTDTSTWNPEHFAFQVLNVKPGGPPICHFLNSDTIVWVPI